MSKLLYPTSLTFHKASTYFELILILVIHGLNYIHLILQISLYLYMDNFCLFELMKIIHFYLVKAQK